MPHFVNDRCVMCKYTDCVEVCPVDCFFEGDKTLVIDSDICIDCEVCVIECPIGAIMNDSTVIEGKKFSVVLEEDEAGKELTEDQRKAVNMFKFNRHYSQKWPVITSKKDPMPSVDDFKDNLNKLSYIEDELKNVDR